MHLRDVPFKTMTYRELIAHILRRHLVNEALTQLDLAKALGFKSGNIVSMHCDPENAVSPFPLARLPALKVECKLDWYACLVLLHKRALHHADGAAGSTRMDVPTTHFVLKCGECAPGDFRTHGYAAGGACYGC
jgi:hypothetical protein